MQHQSILQKATLVYIVGLSSSYPQHHLVSHHVTETGRYEG